MPPKKVHSNAWYGCRRDTKDQRDYMYKPRVIRLPRAVDLRKHCPPVMDQGTLGSCTAHGIIGALRYEKMKAGKADIKLSRLQIYYDERAMEGTVRSDAGAEIRSGIKTASKIGIGGEEFWPYKINQFATKPPAAVYRNALHHKALVYQRLEVSSSALKQALAAGHCPIIGITVYESFESEKVARTGMIPMPGKKEKVVGGHCMYVVGYGQKTERFTVRNSWKKDWGDKGDCYIPYSYLGSKLLGADYWVITQV